MHNFFKCTLIIFSIQLIVSCSGKSNKNAGNNEQYKTARISSEIVKDTFDYKALIGHWIAYKKTTTEGGDISEYALDKENPSVYLSLNILDSDTVIYDAGIQEYKLKYSIEDNKLIISNQSYIIVSLTTNELVLKEEIVLGGLIYLKKN